jgi:cytochrome c biogenesis protein CcdA
MTPSAAAPWSEVTTQSDVLILFHGEGCPHCAAEREFLVGLAERHPDLEIRQYEVWRDEANRELLTRYANELAFDPRGVPVTIVGEQVWVGFSEVVAQEIETAVTVQAPGDQTSDEPGAAVDVPLIGVVSLESSSLLVSTLAIAFVDGINPCSLWVLSVLLAIVLHSGSRGRVALVGSVFLVVTAGMYGLYIVGFYSALDYASEVEWIALLVASVAFIFGGLQLKDGVFPGKGPSLSISAERRPELYRRMRSLATADHGLATVIGATIVLAVGVSLLETPCTAGLPLLWTNLLSQQDVSSGAAVALFALYMIVFLLDELMIFAVAVFTLRATRIQEQHGQLLKIIAGSVLVTLAATMLIAPQTLTTLTGTAAVFAIAATLALAVWLWARSRRTSNA